MVGFLLIRRRFDRLLSFFAWFAVLYGERLWLQSIVLRLMEPPSLMHRLLLYTDGVIEAARPPIALRRSSVRSGQVLTARAGKTVEERADLILSTVQDWASTQLDDLTVVVCDCH